MSQPTVFDVARILTAHAQARFGDNVALIAYYGSHAQGRASATSDLDLFYIPDPADAAGALCSQFVLNGMPYDLWPISWSFAEALADGSSSRPWAVSASLIADARVLHARSAADRARFEALQQRVARLTEPAARPLMIARAADAMNEVFASLGQLQLAVSLDRTLDCIWAAQKLINSVVNVLALVNQRYFHSGYGACWPDVLRLPALPENLDALAAATLNSAAPERLAAATRLVHALQQLVTQARATVASPVEPRAAFNGLYAFIVEYADKVNAACQRGDVHTARAAALQLQEEIGQQLQRVASGIDAVQSDAPSSTLGAFLAAGLPDMTDAMAQADLAGLRQLAAAVRDRMRVWLVEQGVALDIVTDVQVLPAWLNRDLATG